jgi:hypothetical protein
VSDDRKSADTLSEATLVEQCHPHFLHANFLLLHNDEAMRASFESKLRGVLRTADAARVASLLSGRGPRRLLVGAWIAGIVRDATCLPRIGALLVESDVPFLGQGCAFYLARVGGPEAAGYLSEYLSHWLPVGERKLDQDWVAGALAHVERGLGEALLARFTADHTAWEVRLPSGRPAGRVDWQLGERTMKSALQFMTRFDDVRAAG